MQRVDYFSGETVNDPVSPISPQEELAAQFANFGVYQYGGPSPQQIYPGGYGYNMQQPSSYYYNPMYQQQYYQPYNPYMPAGGFGGGIGMGGNPAFAYMQQTGYYPNYNQQFQQPLQQDITIDIKPFNPYGSDFLPPSNYQEELDRLQQEYWMEQEKAEAKRKVDDIGRANSNSYFNNGYNYYGTSYYNSPWSNPYYNSSINTEYINRLKEMEAQAKQARVDMNIGISRLVHNFLGDTYEDQKLQEMYSDRTITIPGQKVTQIQQVNRLANLVPFDNSQMYRDQQARVTAQFRKYIPKDADLKTTFENMALVAVEYELEEEEHRRRREQKERYNSNGYKYLIQKKLMEDYAKERGVDLNGGEIVRGQETSTSTANKIKNEILHSGMFPTLTNSATLADDGTLHITYNSTTDYGGIQNNVNEDKYEEQRRKFNSFLNSIPGSINLMNNTPIAAEA